jgi:hypothetical protein
VQEEIPMESGEVSMKIPAPAVVAEQTQKFTSPVLTAMIVESMVGAGISRCCKLSPPPSGRTVRYCQGRRC